MALGDRRLAGQMNVPGGAPALMQPPPAMPMKPMPAPAPVIAAPVAPVIRPKPTGGLRQGAPTERPQRPSPGTSPSPAPQAKPPRTPAPTGPPNPWKDTLPPRFLAMVKNGMPELDARKRWSGILRRATPVAPNPAPAPGPAPNPGPAPPPAMPAPPGQQPGDPGPTLYPMPQPSPFPQPGGGMPYPDPGMPMPGMPQQPGGYSFDDAYNVFLSAAPVMQANAQRQIADSMATAGFTGNRWSSSAEQKAGEIGAETAMQQNALLNQLLYGMTEQDKNRALQATQQGIGLGGMLDQQAQDRVRLPFEVGQYEQGRQDRYANMAYEDFERNKLGWLPMLLQGAMSQGSGSPGQIYQTQGEPAKPGALDWFNALGPVFASFF